MQSLNNASYAVYDVIRHRWRYSGKAMMPVAGPDPQAAETVKLHAAQEYEAITFVIARDGAVPDIPHHTELESDPNYEFLRFHFGGYIQFHLVDGRVRYQVMGTYEYGLKVPTGLSNGYNLGILPWSQDPVSQEKIPGPNFRNGLLNTASQQPPIQPPPQLFNLIQDQ